MSESAVLRLEDIQLHPLIERLLEPNIHRRTKDYGQVSHDKLNRREADYTPIFQRVPYDNKAAARWAQEHAYHGSKKAAQLRSGRASS